MALDNSWDVMCEEEMYDVNGGWSVAASGFIGFKIGWFTVKIPTRVSMSFSMLDCAWIVSAGIAAILVIATAINALPGVGQIGCIVIIKCFATIIATAGFLAVCAATNDHVQQMNTQWFLSMKGVVK